VLTMALQASKPPVGLGDADWFECCSKMYENTATIEEILHWSISAGLVRKQNGLYYCTDALYERGRFDSTFCSIFFPKVVHARRKIPTEQFIQALTHHEPLCRWITKQVVAALTHRNERNNTWQQLANNAYKGFLEEVLRLYLR
jgi:hypothetical protein